MTNTLDSQADVKQRSGATVQLAEFVSELQFSDLPDETVHKAKLPI